ncbi:virulence promoting factor [Shimwellia pseudoproteus]|nr:virulence promoting factor [Shimwellia pseudoproteus]MBJ3814192.1 virulence promoting factor [Shimwellia pseudoproteus]
MKQKPFVQREMLKICAVHGLLSQGTPAIVVYCSTLLTRKEVRNV